MAEADGIPGQVFASVWEALEDKPGGGGQHEHSASPCRSSSEQGCQFA